MTQPQQPNPDQDDKPLAPIPSDGTSAPPSDSERVFGKGAGEEQSGQRSEGSGQQRGQSGPQPGQSGGPGGPGPSREPLSEEEQRTLRIRGRMAIILGFGGLFVGVLFLPSGIAFGLPLALAGGVVGFGAYRRGRKAGTTVPGAMPGMVIGGIALVITLVIGAVSAMFASELQRFSSCMDGANTQIAQDSCLERFDQDMQDRGYDLDLSEIPGTSGASGFFGDPGLFGDGGGGNDSGQWSPAD